MKFVLPKKQRLKFQEKSLLTTTITLPTEIIKTEILPRLPTKSLFRFKCVCKSWHRLITSSKFSTLHRSLSPDNDAEYLLFFPCRRPMNKIVVQEFNSSSSQVIARLPFPGQYDQNRVTIVGTCNGLLCMAAAYRHEILVINPLTNSYRNRKFPSSSDHLELNHRLLSRRFGFGYDSVADDYKIVKLVHYENHNFDSPWEVTLYSLRDDSWRTVKSATAVPRIEHLIMRFEVTTTVGGAVIDNHIVHWIVFDQDDDEYLISCRIICFDLISENWMEDVPLPESYADERCHGSNVIDLGVLDGCLCLSTRIKRYESRGCAWETGLINVWIMKEYGVKESWVKLLHMLSTHPPIMLSPVIHGKRSRTGEMLLQKEHNPKTGMDYQTVYKRSTELVSYNFRDKSLKPAASMSGLSHSLKVCLHRASLVNVCSFTREQPPKYH